MNNSFAFTGSQQNPTYEQRKALYNLFLELIDNGFHTMHNGDCIGSDSVAWNLWVGIGVLFDEYIWTVGHPPDIQKKRAFNRYDKYRPEKPYLVRNKNMVNEGQLLVACPDGFEPKLRSGTWSTIRYAQKKGKPVIFVYPDGSIQR